MHTHAYAHARTTHITHIAPASMVKDRVREGEQD